MYSIVYYDKDDDHRRMGKMCNTFDEIIEFVSRLQGFRHIDILEFDKLEL